MKTPIGRIACCVALMLTWCMALSGCTDLQLGQAKQSQEKLQASVDTLKASVADLKARATTMPAGKEKDESLAVAAKAESVLGQVQTQLDAATQLRQGLESGDSALVGSGVTTAISAIPGVGPYAGLIGIGVGVIATWIQSKKKAEAMEAAEAAAAAAAEETEHLMNVVKSIETLPGTWTEETKATVAAVQGSATSARVDAIKREENL